MAFAIRPGFIKIGVDAGSLTEVNRKLVQAAARLGLRPTPRKLLSCLKPGELGSPEFTLDGWLQTIEKPATNKPRDE